MIINNLKDLVLTIKEEKAKGNTVAIKSGIFDIIHPGYINMLEELKKHVDIVIVWIRSDEYAVLKKGDKRPINPQADRVITMNGLKNVDYVYPDSCMSREETIALLRKVKADYFVLSQKVDEKAENDKTRQYKNNGIGILRIKEKIKGPQHSTTNIVNRIVSRYSKTNS